MKNGVGKARGEKGVQALVGEPDGNKGKSSKILLLGAQQVSPKQQSTSTATISLKSPARPRLKPEIQADDNERRETTLQKGVQAKSIGVFGVEK